jgi:hypothetical protein
MNLKMINNWRKPVNLSKIISLASVIPFDKIYNLNSVRMISQT